MASIAGWRGFKALALNSVAIIFFSSLIFTSCKKEQAVQISESEKEWIGVYTSPGEIGGYSSMAIAIESDSQKGLVYRMIFHSDVKLPDDKDGKEKKGFIKVTQDRVSMSTHFGEDYQKISDFDPEYTRFKRLRIMDHVVLMRSDALKAYENENELYDYGILIKVSDDPKQWADLESAKHESIGVLRENPLGEWKDPFVNGPNSR